MMGGSRGALRGRLVGKGQGWSLSISRSGVGFRRFSYIYDDTAVVPPGWGLPASPRVAASRRRLWLAPLLLGGGSIAAGVLAAPAMSTGSTYSVSVPVPDRVVPAVRRPPRVAIGRYAAPARRHRVAVGDDDAATSDTEAMGAGTNELTEQRYTDRAMRTGEMQSWQADSVRYFLVAGDLQRADDKACRQFSLLARPDGGADTVRHFERCHAVE